MIHQMIRLPPAQVDLSGVAPSVDLLASYELIEVRPASRCRWKYNATMLLVMLHCVNQVPWGARVVQLSVLACRQDMLSARAVASALAGTSDQTHADGVAGRTVLLVGEAARQRAGILMETMRGCGCPPAIIAALVPKHLGATLKGAAERIR